ncbi:5982_t:CDS:2 [Entrophospora sp. SA101]|nr:5982_t:CDS:2 [Entrophospora sp. SA101]
MVITKEGKTTKKKIDRPANKKGKQKALPINDDDDEYDDNSRRGNKRKLEDDEEIDVKTEEDEDVTKGKKAKESLKKRIKQQKTTEPKANPNDDDKMDIEEPVKKKTVRKKSKPRIEEEMDIKSEDEEPVKKKQVRKKSKPRIEEEMDIEDEGPVKKKQVRKKSKPRVEEEMDIKTEDEGSTKKKLDRKKSKPKIEEDEPEPSEGEDEDFQWWKGQSLDDGSAKWTTLVHNGVCFPPEYVPHNIKMKYNGREIKLSPEAEEVATFYAALLNTDYVKNDTFNENFFKDWQVVLKESEKNPSIKHFDKCDFTSIYDYLQQEKERKKNFSKEEKQRLKDEKTRIDEFYGYCYLDGRKEKVGNFRIEPPGLFKGRGEHPKTGSLKLRVTPEQITINLSKDAPVPPPPAGHSWGGILHDNTVTWLATWKENVNDSIKYVFLAANSSLKGQSDLKKFDKARELDKHVEKIRCDYTQDLKDRLNSVRQRATAMYLIDRLALRAGNEKTGEEADTVGCCSLRCEHITLVPPRTVEFDFLGKDSIRYVNSVEVIEQVFKNLRIFMKDKKSNIDEKEKVLKSERKSGKINMRKGQTSEKLRIQIEKLTERINTTKLLKQDKEDNKTTALGTSKINYLDPRISVAWCKKYDVPIAKIFNKSLREKFRWALDVDADWEF